MKKKADTSELMLECEITAIQQIKKVLNIKDKPRIIYIETNDLYTLKRIFSNENLYTDGISPVLRDAIKLSGCTNPNEKRMKTVFPENILYINVHEYDGISKSGGFTVKIREIFDEYLKNLVLPEADAVTERCYVLCGKLSDEDFEKYEAIKPYYRKVIIPHLTPNDIDTLLNCYGFEGEQSERDFYRRELEEFDRETACQVFEIIYGDVYGGVNNIRGAMKKIKDFKHSLCGSKGALRPVFSPDSLLSGKEPEYNAKGLENLYEWLKLEFACLSDFRAYSLLLLGVPGIGKTTFAMDAASFLGVDLYMLKVGDILDKYVGESEKKIEKIFKNIAFLSPCVLMIDEIEKCFPDSRGNEGSSSVNKHILKELLAFMDNKDHRVFTVATANSIDNLPRELFRSMRFDGKFALFLPEKESCIDILEFHLKANGYDVGKIGTRKEAEALFKEIIKDEANPKWFLSGADLCEAAQEVCRLFKTHNVINENGERKYEPHDFYRTVEPFLTYSVRVDSKPSVRKYAQMYYDLLKHSLPRAGKGEMVSSEITDKNGNVIINDDIKVWKFSSEETIIFDSLSKTLSGGDSKGAAKTYDGVMSRILKEEISTVAKQRGEY